jgi:2',3'-cyclic-nucleotide 2'-phosphodiesterase (5'-nucleotidase family)
MTIFKRTVFIIFLSFVTLFPPAPGGRSGGAALETELFFTILHTNDEHSALLPAPLVDYDPAGPGPTRGGFARLAHLVEAIRAAKSGDNEPVLLISGGDFLGGSPYSWLAFRNRAAELALMLGLGYDVVTLGNHEYDFGPERLAEYLMAAGYPEAAARTAIVASNTHLPPGHPLGEVGIRQTYIRVLNNGLILGFFGLIGRDALQVSPFKDPVEFSGQHETARADVAALRQAGAQVVIAVSHCGIGEDRALARAVPGIDVIVGGHSHSRLEEPVIEGGTVIVQAGSLLRYLGVLELAYNPSTGKVRPRNCDTGRPFLLPVDGAIPEHPAAAAALDLFTRELNRLASELTGGKFGSVRDIVAVSGFDVPIAGGREAPLGNFVTDALRLVAAETLGEKVHFAFQASGPIRGSIITGKTAHSQGKIAFFDLANLVGLGSGLDGNPGFPVVSFYLTGAEVVKVMEISIFLSEHMGQDYFLQASGLRATYDFKRAILGQIPFTGLPVPTGRAVLAVEMFTGEGVQGGGADAYTPLSRRDRNLYHVVTDYGVATAIPRVGELVPFFLLQPKDSAGNPVALEDRIIRREGRELKVWQAVVEYASRQPLDERGAPRIADLYAGTTGRLVEGKGTPLWIWPALFPALLAAPAVFLARRRRLRRRARQK